MALGKISRIIPGVWLTAVFTATSADCDSSSFETDRFHVAVVESRGKLRFLLDWDERSHSMPPEWFRTLRGTWGTPMSEQVWYGPPDGPTHYIRILHRVPGTLGEDILRFQRDLPKKFYGISIEIHNC